MQVLATWVKTFCRSIAQWRHSNTATRIRFAFVTFRGKLALFGISKFKYEKKNEMDSGSNSKITQMAY